MLRPVFVPVAVALLSLAGCVADNAKHSEPPVRCANVGEICTLSPGKLGLCVESTSDGAKLICQSQH